MSSEKRPYRKKKRAESEADTRRRITESAVELHGSIGPSRTSMSAVAERAGVPRSTLYRHFPHESALFEACSAHWAAANPPPDLTTWASMEDPDERARSAIEDLYAFYRRNEAMLANLIRDEETNEFVRRQFRAYHAYMEAAEEELLRGRRERAQARVRVAAAIGHALSFTTWRSLVRDQSLGNTQAAALMSGLVSEAGSRRPVRA